MRDWKIAVSVAIVAAVTAPLWSGSRHFAPGQWTARSTRTLRSITAFSGPLRPCEAIESSHEVAA
jgi:hypothetical protein